MNNIVEDQLRLVDDSKLLAIIHMDADVEFKGFAIDELLYRMKQWNGNNEVIDVFSVLLELKSTKDKEERKKLLNYIDRSTKN
jgi:Xaa-Pro aminopeptidase